MLRTTLQGSLYVGVYAHATDEACFVGAPVPEETVASLSSELESDVLPCTVGGAATVGALVAANAAGVVVSGRLTDRERDAFEEAIAGPVAELPGLINAAGNCLLVNDHGAIAHPDMGQRAIEVVRSTLEVPVERLTIGGMQTVGTAAVATNRGVLCHPKVTDEEFETLESVLGVRADVGTVNYGSPLIGSGLIANGTGFVTGQDTTGPELGRIEEALGLLE